jgi:cation transporter-like permease
VSCGDWGSFAAKSSTNTRELRWPTASMANARLATDFHQNHAQSPLTVFCGVQFLAVAFGVILMFSRALIFVSFERFLGITFSY